MNPNISPHITYREATNSALAIKHGIENIPNDEQLHNMKLVAMKVFEPLRMGLLGRIIRVSSFFRSEELNIKAGGVNNSQHLANNGAAIDLDNDDEEGGPKNKEIFDFIKDNLVFDQLIWEYGDDKNPSWVHVSYHEGHNRGEIWRTSKGGYEKYYK